VPLTNRPPYSAFETEHDYRTARPFVAGAVVRYYRKRPRAHGWQYVARSGFTEPARDSAFRRGDASLYLREAINRRLWSMHVDHAAYSGLTPKR
jgi:hypothetical protein